MFVLRVITDYDFLRRLFSLNFVLDFILLTSASTCACYLYLNTIQKFRLHLLINADREFIAQKSASHRDFYNIRKVDTHVHHSACMNQKHLLHFIKSKLRKEPDEVYFSFLLFWPLIALVILSFTYFLAILVHWFFSFLSCLH